MFNPSEVIPEYTADVGVKKGEKVYHGVGGDPPLEPRLARPTTVRA